MKLGAFSVSLAVQDIHASKEFYQKLGFTVFAGNIDQNYLIMKNGDTIIGLFQGMFENNILTFNPGWDQNANTLDNYDDIRNIQSELKARGIDSGEPISEGSQGPANFMVVDPDGNTILVDQHV